jgi:hypothetical protein
MRPPGGDQYKRRTGSAGERALHDAIPVGVIKMCECGRRATVHAFAAYVCDFCKLDGERMAEAHAGLDEATPEDESTLGDRRRRSASPLIGRFAFVGGTV